MAVDYFQHHYPNSTIMFDMSTVYITSACVAVVANNLLLDLFTYNTRITFGTHLMFFILLSTFSMWKQIATIFLEGILEGKRR